MFYLSKILLVVITPVIFQHSFSDNNNEKWKAPESADKLINAVPSNSESIEQGKQIFKKLCWTCHGNTGKGDGPASKSLKPKPADFSSLDFNEQTDGAIFWKITEGRGNMASYKSSLSVKQRWQLVNYLRTLKQIQ
jgi:mono/diheme cytochrome c family protein